MAAAAGIVAEMTKVVESMKETKGNLTYRELHKRTTAKLKSNQYDQVPQLEGQRASFDRMFLS